MFEEFNSAVMEVNGTHIFFRIKGKGEPLLLLHGFPQTHAMWAIIAPMLAKNYTVICSDLRGYGASGKPQGIEQYTFRRIGSDQLQLMTKLGFKRFHLVGHDRGGRTAHRMALDAGGRVKSLTLMDIVPTYVLLNDLKREVAQAYYHWFFLSQPSPFPEKLIATDPDYFFQNNLTAWGASSLSEYRMDQLQAYRTAWRDPQCIRAMCDDYRATSDFDFSMDEVDLPRRISVPALVVWGSFGAMARSYDMKTIWEERLCTYQTATIKGGHFFPDTAPKETVEALLKFLATID